MYVWDRLLLSPWLLAGHWQSHYSFRLVRLCLWHADQSETDRAGCCTTLCESFKLSATITFICCRLIHSIHCSPEYKLVHSLHCLRFAFAKSRDLFFIFGLLVSTHSKIKTTLSTYSESLQDPQILNESTPLLKIWSSYVIKEKMTVDNFLALFWPCINHLLYCANTF